jgi:hypothetical protein
MEQKRLEEEAKENEKEGSSSSDSDDEVMPALLVMKDHNRAQRHERKDAALDKIEDAGLAAGQNRELNFVYDDMMNLRNKMIEEDQEREDQDRKQRLLDQYMEHQRKQMQRIFKKNANRKFMKIDPQVRFHMDESIASRKGSRKGSRKLSIMGHEAGGATPFKRMISRQSTINPTLPKRNSVRRLSIAHAD